MGIIITYYNQPTSRMRWDKGMFFMAQVSSISIQDEALAAMHDIVGHLI